MRGSSTPILTWAGQGCCAQGQRSRAESKCLGHPARKGADDSAIWEHSQAREEQDRVVQLVKRPPCDRLIAGSNPTRRVPMRCGQRLQSRTPRLINTLSGGPKFKVVNSRAVFPAKGRSAHLPKGQSYSTPPGPAANGLWKVKRTLSVHCTNVKGPSLLVGP